MPNDRVRLQVRTNIDPELWSDVGTGTNGVPVPVEVESSALPTGAATSANQTNGNQKSKIVLVDENGVQSQMLGDTYYAGAPITIDVSHHEIHCGDMVSISNKVDLGNGATRDILIITPTPTPVSKRYHLIIDINTEAEADIEFYEDTTVSGNGAAITGYNRNRQDPVVVPANEVSFYHTPTVTGVGNSIEGFHFGSGKSAGGGVRGMEEWVLGNNKKYLLRITNATTSNNYISIRMNYYVHPGV